MKYTITPLGGEPFIMADHGIDGPDMVTPVPIRRVDVNEYVRALFSKPKNRGNTLNQLTFMASKEHASYTAAQLYLFRLNETVPMGGTLDIELEDQLTHIEAYDATVEVVPLPIVGLLTTLTYTVKYGKINMVYMAVLSMTSDGKQRIDANGKKIFVRKEIL